MTTPLGRGARPAYLDRLLSPKRGELFRVVPPGRSPFHWKSGLMGRNCTGGRLKADASIPFCPTDRTKESADARSACRSSETLARGMLENFLRLHEQSDESIRVFASRWGPLGICMHGLPHTHWPLTRWDAHAARIVRQARELAAIRRQRARRAASVLCAS